MQIYSSSRGRISEVVVNINCAVLKNIWRVSIVSAERCLRPQHSVGMYQLSNWFSLFRLKWDISIKWNWILTFHITDIQSTYEPNFLHRRHNGNKAVNIGALWRLKHVYFLDYVMWHAKRHSMENSLPAARSVVTMEMNFWWKTWENSSFSLQLFLMSFCPTR